MIAGRSAHAAAPCPRPARRRASADPAPLQAPGCGSALAPLKGSFKGQLGIGTLLRRRSSKDCDILVSILGPLIFGVIQISNIVHIYIYILWGLH